MIITEFEKEMLNMFSELSTENKKKVIETLLGMIKPAKERQVM